MSRMFQGFRTLRRALALAIILALSGLGASTSPALGSFPQICPQRRSFFNAFDLLNYVYYRYDSNFGYYYEMGNYEYWYNAGFFGWKDGGQDHPDYYCGMVQWH